MNTKFKRHEKRDANIRNNNNSSESTFETEDRFITNQDESINYNRATINEKLGNKQNRATKNEFHITSIGHRLKQARESLPVPKKAEEIADQLRLAVEIIDRIENDEFLNQPSNPFVRGYIRNYARLVGIPDKEITDYFMQSGMISQPSQNQSIRQVQVVPRGHGILSEKGLMRKSAKIIFYLMLIVIVSIVIVMYNEHRTPPAHSMENQNTEKNTSTITENKTSPFEIKTPEKTTQSNSIETEQKDQPKEITTKEDDSTPKNTPKKIKKHSPKTRHSSLIQIPAVISTDEQKIQ